MISEIEIPFDIVDIEDDFRFANSILETLIAAGLPSPRNNPNKNPIRIVAEHIHHTLGFNGCRVVHENFGAGTITFYKL